jgi:hypothetical protein
MNNVRVTLALVAAAALGAAAAAFVNGTSSAYGNANNALTLAMSEMKTKRFAEVAMPPNVAAAGESRAGIANPFPALTAPIAGLAQSAVETAGITEGVADLNPFNRSGIRALVSVKKIGQTETITGFATNMDPYKAYVSLFYDAGSPGSGPCACIPSNPLPSGPSALQTTCKASAAPPVNFSQMVIGYWLPLIGSSTRTLHVLKAGAADAPAPLAYVPLENIGAISVREDTQLGQPLPAAPDPNRFQLRACGKFRLESD